MSCTFASKVSAESKGRVIGFRVWTLKAYNSSGHVVAEVSEDMGNNTKKFIAFLHKVAEANYCLNAEQINYINRELLLDLPQVDNTYIRKGVKGVFGADVAGQAGVGAAAAANAALSELGISI
jgi:hypothetical protein